VKRHRYKTSFLLTALLYILPVTCYLYLSKKTIVSDQKPKAHTIELALSQFVPQPAPSAAPVPIHEEQPLKEEPEPKEEPVRKKPESKVPPKRVPEKILPKEAILKPPSLPKAKPVVKKKHITKQRKKKPGHKKHVKKRVHPKRRISGGGTPRYSAAQKNAFLAAIRRKINRAKSYPRIAQRRGLQGVVNVQFTIFPNGRVGNITFSGPRIFYASARKAVENAFPVNPKKATLRLPASVTLSLHYKLRH
jgi:protein TonB